MALTSEQRLILIHRLGSGRGERAKTMYFGRLGWGGTARCSHFDRHRLRWLPCLYHFPPYPTVAGVAPQQRLEAQRSPTTKPLGALRLGVVIEQPSPETEQVRPSEQISFCPLRPVESTLRVARRILQEYFQKHESRRLERLSCVCSSRTVNRHKMSTFRSEQSCPSPTLWFSLVGETAVPLLETEHESLPLRLV